MPDLNHDGFADLAVIGRLIAGLQSKLAVFLAAGSAVGLGVGSPRVEGGDLGNLPAFIKCDFFPGAVSESEADPGILFQNIAAGDFNGDGFNDLVIVAQGLTGSPTLNRMRLFGLHGSNGPKQTVDGGNFAFGFDTIPFSIGSDLKTWTSVGELDNPTGAVSFDSPIGAAANQYFRATVP